MLAAKCYPAEGADKCQPWLVFIHGLLGDGQDWQEVLPHISGWSCMTIDLPGHGGSKPIAVENFEQMSDQLRETLLAHDIQRYILIGYSLGGRCAMYHGCFSADDGLAGLVIEGGNPGLINQQQRDERQAHDQLWADKFRHYPLPDVLDQWYRQPVFASLNEEARQRLILRRGTNSGAGVAKMLESTSLGQQPWLTERLSQLVTQRNLPFCYLCGEQDAKFQQIALENHFPLRIVAAAGHNAHVANPKGFADQLINFLKEC
ncbi:2-succinyl-6-hydroxy-2,4-cyclohexadiene-1-carboxylate synthase [Pragia fontium]|uniref:2-succinyl-6-hydroxy-2,4-cyclohexadiene-1-carboxylate synthase n=1 Tax=Pragia fontium TaxID=82985 RepID=A0ABQ5LGE3_9GAMM|nr:2-succinyl-6-hydroxy-2,4-cyclohexadiene-1-carboxylate synthase [Pragia fontium]GKX62419.1 2-succinyl-6-hydroxy-2,4-cyclohexadiene-1-carboxylate synthase [Pragia fontium]